MDKEKFDKLQKFYTDPDWKIVEGIIKDKIFSLRNVKTIDTKMNSDAIAAEVRGRQIASEELESFLTETKIFAPKETKHSSSFE